MEVGLIQMDQLGIREDEYRENSKYSKCTVVNFLQNFIITLYLAFNCELRDLRKKSVVIRKY